jgi:hypothetical protein
VLHRIQEGMKTILFIFVDISEDLETKNEITGQLGTEDIVG